MLKFWNMLIILTFLLVILGTFAARGGGQQRARLRGVGIGVPMFSFLAGAASSAWCCSSGGRSAAICAARTISTRSSAARPVPAQ